MDLTDIKRLYPDNYYWDYQPLLNLLGEIVIQEDEEGYQGDSFILYKKDDQYGYLNFGWGSCSGCDALQACTSIEEVHSLAETLNSDIHWGSLDTVIDYINSRSSDYYCGSSTFKVFKERVNDLEYIEQKH